MGNEYSWFDYNHKLKTTIRKSDTLHFAYDALGNRNMKAKENKDSLFYVNDLQGNIMATYKLKNDSLYLVDQPLYGSSRLGTETMSRLLWQRDTNVYYSNALYSTVRGNKQYEIANHLGNVLATVSDKKVGVDTTADNLYDYYEPVEITATDYYAYGGMLPERNQEFILMPDSIYDVYDTSHPCVLSQNFDPSLSGWNVSDSEVHLYYDGGSMRVRTWNVWQGPYITFNTVPGVNYTVRLYMRYGSDYVYAMEVKDSINTSFLNWQYINKGSAMPLTLTFTATQSIAHFRLDKVATHLFSDTVYVDSLFICTTDEVIDTITHRVGTGYVFSFNGKMKDDEINQGTYHFGMRNFDSRIPYPLRIDPLKNKFPYLSPYQFFSNNPVWNIDLDGLEGIKYTAYQSLNNDGKPIQSVSTEYDVNGRTDGVMWELHKQDGTVVTKFMPDVEIVTTRSLSNIVREKKQEMQSAAISKLNAADKRYYGEEGFKRLGEDVSDGGNALKIVGIAATVTGSPEIGIPLYKAGEHMSNASSVVGVIDELSQGNIRNAGIEAASLTVGYYAGKKLDALEDAGKISPSKATLSGSVIDKAIDWVKGMAKESFGEYKSSPKPSPRESTSSSKPAREFTSSRKPRSE